MPILIYISVQIFMRHPLCNCKYIYHSPRILLKRFSKQSWFNLAVIKYLKGPLTTKSVYRALVDLIEHSRPCSHGSLAVLIFPVLLCSTRKLFRNMFILSRTLNWSTVLAPPNAEANLFWLVWTLLFITSNLLKRNMKKLFQPWKDYQQFNFWCLLHPNMSENVNYFRNIQKCPKMSKKVTKY